MENTIPASDFQPADEMVITDLKTLRVLADRVRQTVELAAEIGGVAGETGQTPIQGVEDHRQENRQATDQALLPFQSAGKT